MKEDPIIRDGGENAIDDFKNFKTIDNEVPEPCTPEK